MAESRARLNLMVKRVCERQNVLAMSNRMLPELMDVDPPENPDESHAMDSEGWAEEDMARARNASLNEAYAANQEEYLVLMEAGPSTRPGYPTRHSSPVWDATRRRPPTPHPTALKTIPSPLRLPRALFPNASYTSTLGESAMLGEREARTGNVYTATLTTRAQVEQQRRSRALAMFTPPPPGGFESPCLGDPEALFEGLPRHRISGIMNEPEGTVIMVCFFNAGFPRPGQVQAMTEALATTVQVVTGEVNPLICPPDFDWSAPASARVKSKVWVILKLKPASTDQMMARGAWSGPEASIFPYRPEVIIEDYLFTIEGLTRDYQNDIFNTVYAVFDGPVVRPTTAYLVQSNPDYADMDPEDAVECILASLKVRVDAMSGGQLLAAVYCKSPTRSVQRWRAWRDTITRLPFPTSYNLTGRARPRSSCAGCHAADHLTHLCPYPDIPGWHSPPAGGNYSYTTNGNPPPPPPAPGPAHRAMSVGPAVPRGRGGPAGRGRGARGRGDARGAGRGDYGFGGNAYSRLA